MFTGSEGPAKGDTEPPEKESNGRNRGNQWRRDDARNVRRRRKVGVRKIKKRKAGKLERKKK